MRGALTIRWFVGASSERFGGLGAGRWVLTILGRARVSLRL